MPDFARAKIQSPAEELGEYKAFLRTLKEGQRVALPLEEGETSRTVMRGLNRAAAESQMRLLRLPSDRQSVRFVVHSAEKRSVNISPEKIRERTERAKATRAARRRTAPA
jgi:hypothetical protein